MGTKMFFVGLFAVSAFLWHGMSGAGSDGVSVSVMEGDSVTLNTDVKINQQEKIHWHFNDDVRIAYINGDLSDICTDVQCNKGTERFRDRLKLDHQTGSLTIMNITNTDSGVYKLQIIKGSENETIFNVTVHGVSAAERDEICVKEGENVTLYSGVIKKTIDSMTWYFNDTPIVEITEDQCKIWTDVQWRLEVNQTGSLIITNIRTTDSGLYQLQINSSRFSIIRRFSVTVTNSGPPSGIRVTVPLPIQKGMDCKGSCVPDSGPPSGIRVTVFRGRIDCCDLMNVLYKGRQDEIISSGICQKSKDEMEKGHVI